MKLTSIILAAGMLALPGCAAIQRQGAADSQSLLAEAGFQKAELEAGELKTIASLQLTAHGEHYDFADARFCQCRYVGGQKELAVLNDLRAARVQAHERAVRGIGITSGGADERAWGPWNPQGLDVK